MINRDIDVITIRGAPGTGKTQTAKCLEKHFPRGVRMEIDSLRSMIISVEWTNQKEHINILSLSMNLVLDFLRLGYRPVVVVDTFSGDKLDKYLTDLRRMNERLVIRSFALVTDAEELKKRLENRPQNEFKDFEISHRLNSHVTNHPNSTEVVIDTTGVEPEGTVQELLQTLDNH